MNAHNIRPANHQSACIVGGPSEDRGPLLWIRPERLQRTLGRSFKAAPESQNLGRAQATSRASGACAAASWTTSRRTHGCGMTGWGRRTNSASQRMRGRSNGLHAGHCPPATAGLPCRHAGHPSPSVRGGLSRQTSLAVSRGGVGICSAAMQPGRQGCSLSTWSGPSSTGRSHGSSFSQRLMAS